MNIKLQPLVTIAGLGMFAASTCAGAQYTVDRIAAEAGVSPTQVRMVLGDRTQYAGYRTSFDFVARKVTRAMDRLAARPEAERMRALAQVSAKAEASDLQR